MSSESESHDSEEDEEAKDDVQGKIEDTARKNTNLRWLSVIIAKVLPRR